MSVIFYITFLGMIISCVTFVFLNLIEIFKNVYFAKIMNIFVGTFFCFGTAFIIYVTYQIISF